MTCPTHLDSWAFAASNAARALEARPGFLEHLRSFAASASDFDGAELIYAELVANVVRHAPGPIWIGFDWTPDRHARLCVRDSGHGFVPAFGLPEDRYSESGRGLAIVAALAETVTVTRDEAGTQVCATLPLRSAA